MRYQDGTIGCSEEITLTHATRPDFIASIMMNGLKTSRKSHGREGLWCQNDDACEAASHDWGRAPLEKFSGCFITLKTPRDHRDLLTSQTRLGPGKRALVKGTPESAQIPVQIVAVTFRIPSV